MIATPNIIYYPSPGNTSFTVTAGASNTVPVNIYADLGGQSLLASIGAGNSATVLASNGFFYGATSDATFSVTATQAFQNSPVVSAFTPARPGNNLLTNSTLGQNSLFIYPFDVPVSLSAYRLNQYISVLTSISASNETASAGVTMSAALYSQGTGTQTDQIASFWSCSAFISMAWSSNSNATFGLPAGISNSLAVSSISTTFAATNASTYLATSIGGFREVPMPVSLVLSPGRFWYAFAQSSATGATADFALKCSYLQETASNQINYQPFGGASSASNASYPQIAEGFGTYSATTGAFPATIALTGGVILGAPIGTYPFFNISAFTTNASDL
jgi:hypothetical protein